MAQKVSVTTGQLHTLHKCLVPKADISQDKKNGIKQKKKKSS
jgi:hypothetical protein